MFTSTYAYSYSPKSDLNEKFHCHRFNNRNSSCKLDSENLTLSETPSLNRLNSSSDLGGSTNNESTSKLASFVANGQVNNLREPTHTSLIKKVGGEYFSPESCQLNDSSVNSVLKPTSFKQINTKSLSEEAYIRSSCTQNPLLNNSSSQNLYTSTSSLYPLRSWKSEINLARTDDKLVKRVTNFPKNYTSTYNTLINSLNTSSNMNNVYQKSKNNDGGKMTIFTGLPMAGSSGRLDVNMLFTQIARINDHLYLCSINALTPQKLQNYGITLVVSAMIDSPPSNIRSPNISNLHVCVEDIETANIKIHFDRVADRIANEYNKGGKIVVHCMAGVSRSTSLVLAYLMKHQNMSLAQAFQHVRSIRPCIHPNAGFWKQLVDYERKLKGFNSVELVNSLGNGLILSNRSNSYSPTFGLFGGSHYRTPSSFNYVSDNHNTKYKIPQWNETDRLSRNLIRPSSYFGHMDNYNSTYRPSSSSNPPAKDLNGYSLFARY